MKKCIYLYNGPGKPYFVLVRSLTHELVHGFWVSNHVKLQINNCIYINIK